MRSSDKGNTSVVLDTADYSLKIAALLKDQVHKKLIKDFTEALERKAVFLLKSSLSGGVFRKIIPPGSKHPLVSEDPQSGGSPDIHREHFWGHYLPPA
jgi:hypothetical protein